ncbi:MAG: cyclic nucleotide-binding domain-containing protein [Spirochaetia bacterium]|jgi:CRP/FNR family cyclic AMP-dependent transcriptional regulator|nr:cyclic nucleotide-binding domain-containing protein [Spirochaetia bacterium]
MSKDKLVRFQKDDTLFKFGDTSREMYIIRSGSVRVVIYKNDQMITLTELGKGHYIGEMSFLTGVPRSATVIAERDLMVSVISPDILINDELGLSNWAVSIAKVLVRRIRQTTELLGNYIVRDSNSDIPWKSEIQTVDTLSMEYNIDIRPGRLYLKGNLSETSIDLLKSKIRELKLKNVKPLILDFSDVIDIDQAGITYLYELTQTSDVADQNIKIENIQLIRDKVLSIKGIQDIITTTKIPVKRIDQGSLLIKQGDIENTMYVVKTGHFTVSRKSSGGEIHLAEAEAGDVIGEMSLIKEGVRSANVKAEKPGVVYVIDIREFYNNIYNVPGWFMELIQGLVQRLRDTNEMLDQLMKNRNDKEKTKKWPTPFCMIMDSSNPGKFLLKGTVTIQNLQYLKQVLRVEISRRTEKIIIDLSKVKQIDKESIAGFLNLYTKLKKKGITLIFEGPQKSILNLFKQYDMDD